MTDVAMQQMYQQVILDHAKQREGFGFLPEFDAESFQRNPVCGDEVRLQVRVGRADDGAGQPRAIVEQVGWEGQGCSISQASLSVLAGLVEGRPLGEVARLEAYFTELMHSRGAGIEDAKADELEDAAAFQGTSMFPARIKCALLGWAALHDALTTTLARDEHADLAPQYRNEERNS